MKIAVVGCGWLGLPLSLSLQDSGHSIVATSRSKEGCSQLSPLGFTCLAFELGDDLWHEKLAPIFDCDLLILNIPVGRKTSSAPAFIGCMEELLRKASSSNIKHLIFVSTSSVYGDQATVVSESSPAAPTTQSAKANLTVEQLAQQYFAKQATILRLSGLVGADRHPVRYLAGKRDLSAPNKVVNLVHQVDVIQGIHSIVKNSIWGHTLLLCAEEHPSRQDYYTWAAKQLGLVLPSFTDQPDAATGKTIDGSHSLEKLGIRLQYPSPYDMLDNPSQD